MTNDFFFNQIDHSNRYRYLNQQMEGIFATTIAQLISINETVHHSIF